MPKFMISLKSQNWDHGSGAGQLLGIDEWGGGINSSFALHKYALLSPGETLNTFQETEGFVIINGEYHCILSQKGTQYYAACCYKFI